jgi:uncharacterized protein DUF6894
MPRYYFDHRDGDTFLSDDEGLELDGIETARDEATRALAGMAKDALPGSVRREIAIEVRDEASRPVLRAALWFEVQTLA